MVRTQIQLTVEQHRRLKRLADRLGVSLSEAVRRCVDDGLAREVEGTGRVDRVREGRSIIGRFGSGQSDVAERHDDYLADAFGS